MAIKLQDIQGDHTITMDVAGQGTAGTPDEFVIGPVPFRAVVTSVRFTPKATITGAATNNFSLSCRNRGVAGTGTALVTAAKTYASGVNAPAFIADALTVTPANANVNAGDVLTIERLVNGSGLAMPAGAVTVTLQAR